MAEQRPWLPLLLFWLSAAIALALVMLVLIAPYLQTPDQVRGKSDLLSLFAYDITVRRTCLASALGLFVTALVCFQPQNFNSPSKIAEKSQRV